MLTSDVVIIGAGIGGLVVALALQRRGIKVKIAEQANQLGEIGAGLTLTPNLTRVLYDLGLEQALSRVILIPKLQTIRHWQSGAILVEKPRGQTMIDKYGYPYGLVHRADLHQILVGAVRANAPDAIMLSKLATEVMTTRTAATASFKDGDQISADLIIGADGVRSRVREALFSTTAPRFTGHVAWRSIVPTSSLPKHIEREAPGLFTGPGKLFMRYPVRSETMTNYAGFARQSGWTVDSWTARASLEDVLSAFDGWHEIVRETLKASDPDAIFKWALYARDPLDSWIEGRVVLMGDAAHAMLPFLGQGAALAVEDGMILARCLAQFLDTDKALATYEAIRKPRCDASQIEATTLADRLQAEAAGHYGKTPLRDEETLGYYAYDSVNLDLHTY
jgi:salicylate hydroxylase